MTNSQRIGSILGGLFSLLLCLIIVLMPEDGLSIVALILCASLMLYGIRELAYYFTMARHMVGGKSVLYIGLIALDAGMFATTLKNMPKLYIALYLLAIHAFSGAIDVLRAMEAKRLGASSWRFSMATGLVNIAVSVVCAIFLRSEQMIAYLYAAGLAWSACVRIAGAFRKTAIVYIQ